MSIVLRSRKTLAQRHRGVLKKYSTSHLWDFGVAQGPLAYAASHTAAEFIAAHPLWPLWQDTAGTVPACKINDQIGLCLDQPTGVVTLGPELVPAITPAGTGWGNSGVGSTVITFGAGTITFVTDGLSSGAASCIGLGVAGRTYQINVTGTGTGQLKVVYGGSEHIFTQTLSCRVVFGATGTAFAFSRVVNQSANTVLTSISVREVIGAHASQTNPLKRPILSGRVNLLTNTQFTGGGAAPTGYIAGATGTSSPSGTASNGSVIYSQTATAQRPFFTRTAAVATTVGQSLTLSMTVTAVSGVRYVDIIGASGVTASFSVDGVSVASTALATPGVLKATWAAIAVSTDARFGIGVVGNATGSVSFHSPDLRPTNSPTNIPAYQRVTSATDYDTVGFPVRALFDGVDDCLVVPSLDLTLTDKVTVVAGVTKLSDALGVICELGVGASVNNGFAIIGYLSYISYLFGTSASDRRFTAAIPAPKPSVLSAKYDLSQSGVATEIMFKENSSSLALTDSGTTSGTGSLSSAPLYIGQRAGTSHPFNGAIQSLAVIGNLLSDGEVQILETSANAAMGKVY